MVAKLPFLLSDQPPEVPRKAGLGDRFHYFRGASGRRYLFSTVAAKDIADFASAVVVTADRLREGKLTARWIASIDAAGHPTCGDRWPAYLPGTIALVHLLSASEAERQALVADLTDLAPAEALRLAA